MISEIMGVFNFIFTVEDQRDWQRRPGCSKNSFSCFFCHMLNVLLNNSINDYEIHDVTYGLGSFYEKCPNLNVIGVDVVKWNWLVKPREFMQMDALRYLTQLREDEKEKRIIVIDPPYLTRPSSKSKNHEILYFNAKQWNYDYLMSVINQAKLKASMVILKYMPTDKRIESELLQMSKYAIHWRFIRYSIPAHNGNKVIRNATQIYIIYA